MFDFWRVRPKKRRVKIRKKGVIFSNPDGFKRSLFRLGNLVLIGCFGYFCYLYQPIIGAWLRYQKIEEKDLGEKIEEVKPRETKEEIVRQVDTSNFWIEIPRIVARAQIEAGVSPFDKNEYLPILKNNLIAQAKGSALPGDGPGKTIYLFAHSTQQEIKMARNNAVFYLLGEMKIGDKIDVGLEDKIYRYQVYEKKVVEAKEVGYLDYQWRGREVLILQTCWPLGTNWKRLLVFTQLAEII